MNDKELVLGNYSYVLEKLNFYEILHFCWYPEDILENKHETLDEMLRNSYWHISMWVHTYK